ncbi:MAG: class I adenylate-forming enzyme family protein [Acidimicrobiales bacterium]
MTTLEGPPLDGFPGIGALTLGGFLDEVTARFGPNEALVLDDPLLHGNTVRWTYLDLRREAVRVAKALRAHGVERGEPVAILMGSRPEAVAALFGAWIAGAVAVPLSTFAPRPELAFLLADSRAVVVLTQTRLLARALADDVAALRPDLPLVRHVAAVGDASWAAFLAAGDAIADERLPVTTPDDDALVVYSSGTTSAPKGTVHDHRAPALQFWVQAQLFRRHEATRLWTALPLFWTAGLNTVMGSTLAAGACWVMQETFEPGAAIALMARERVTEPYSLPHQTGALEEHPDWPTTDLSSLRYVYGKSAFARHPSLTDPDTTWNMPVGYGLSETCAFFVSHWSDTPRELLGQSMGRLLPGNQLRVVDPDSGAVLGPNEDGELALKGPTLMRHYVGRTPAECFDADGFFHTGDAGFVDDEGYVHFTGRRTEMIKTGGANVSPAELEVQLRACPPVKLSRVVGVDDPRLDQVVVACVTLKDGAHATEADVQAFLRERVASYKVPKRVLFFADGDIPMTGSDTKVRDDRLLALVAARLTPSATQSDPVPPTSGDR